MPADTDAPRKSRGGPRRNARRALVQAIYQWQMNESPAEHLLAQFDQDNSLDQADRDFFQDLLVRVTQDAPALDQLYVGLLDRPLERLNGVELAILRLGASELSQRPDIPAPVVIDEYVALARIFGAQDSYKYINGVLARMVQQDDNRD